MKSIAVDGAGNSYVTGDTGSTDFPTANPLQPANAGGSDAFVAKLDPAGSALLFATFLGGGDREEASGIAVDGAGNAYVTGDTWSTDFPTASPIQPALAGWMGSSDAFVAKLDPAGSALLYATYFGGGERDESHGIAVDDAGNSYVTGLTYSTDFPTRGGVRSRSVGDADAFVAKLSGCTPAPGRVALLMLKKVLPSDTLLSWDPEPLSAGGYHIYAVDAKRLVPTANVSRSPACAAPAGETECTHAGSLPPPPATLHYQVVGVCADGFSEGPI